ncbi:2OG-Fe(II) oxygenase [Polaribacter reichenbachii]|uniref:2OG-Fe(II) oxygenase n=1 Tax=Polaribacter reichenbachii TaxID=996801 RepID=A0A1B8TWB9_9FLAO|nr:2OG-Fe(II) oxygenase [Polaribacter reichenbachii]AUC20494.1 2OG-Fe(II) oxygenase [Polaribacter reichenbachii]OBY64031.1 2OG-Fe(II) oxygenase [Polaribacter reichenbachii]
MKRKEIAALIVDRLNKEKQYLKSNFKKTKCEIGFFYIDDLLPKDIVLEIYRNFPKLSETKQRKNLRENKYIAYQMNKYNALLEEVIYSFQDATVLKIISEICEIKNILPDEDLYAGGLSLMTKNNFLSPHLDNSHNKDRELWRVLNLLYYVSPDWKLENGGNLELWNNGVKNKPLEIESRFNRLVVMSTHQNSWHSVNKVLVDDVRCCVSNYYFSEKPLLYEDNFHITTFRGRPKETVKDLFLKIDNNLRSSIRKFFKKGIRENPHQYKK